MKNCGANTARGQPCRNPAGYGTEHAGEGRCYIHEQRDNEEMRRQMVAMLHERLTHAYHALWELETADKEREAIKNVQTPAGYEITEIKEDPNKETCTVVIKRPDWRKEIVQLSTLIARLQTKPGERQQDEHDWDKIGRDVARALDAVDGAPDADGAGE